MMENNQWKAEPRKLKRAIIKEELIAITGNPYAAILLNQFIYWSERVKDYDVFILEENKRQMDAISKDKSDHIIPAEERHGWIYKTAKELAQETMIGLSQGSVRKYLNQLVSLGFLSQRHNPKIKWDQTRQYRVNLGHVFSVLSANGYPLDGYQSPIANSAIAISNSAIGVSNSAIRSDKNCDAIPETTTKITSEITTEIKREGREEKAGLLTTNKKEASLSPVPTPITNLSQNKQGSNKPQNPTVLTETVDDVNDPVYEPIQITPPEMVELWNSTCALAGLPKIIRLTKTRLNKIRLRIKEYDSNPTFWESLFQRIVHTPFLIGENKRGWRVNADFVFDNDTNIARILEGKYDESPNKDDTSLTACLRGAYEGMAAITRREQNSQKEVYRE